MEQQHEKIRASIRALVKVPTAILTGTVMDIDEQDMTIDVLPTIAGDNNALTIYGVQLSAVTESAVGVIQFPKKGSDVIIGVMDGGGEHVLLMASEIDKVSVAIGDTFFTITDGLIEMNKGKLDGLVIVGKNVAQLNKIENDINNLKGQITALLAAAAALPPSSPVLGLALSTLLSTPFTSYGSALVTPTQKVDIENNKITQG